MDPEILKNLKDGPEQQLVVGPLVEFLVGKGWNLKQIVFGKKEWRVPKPPTKEWAETASKPFKQYFTSLADAKKQFGAKTAADDFNYIASVSAYNSK